MGLDGEFFALVGGDPLHLHLGPDPLGQEVAALLLPVDHVAVRLALQAPQELLEGRLAAGAAEVEVLHLGGHLLLLPPDGEQPRLQEPGASGSGDLEADEEDAVLRAKGQLLHVEHGRAALQHARGRDDDVGLPEGLPPVPPAPYLVDARHGLGVGLWGLHGVGVAQHHLVHGPGHAVEEHVALEPVGMEYAYHLVAAAHGESGYQNLATVIVDGLDLAEELLLQLLPLRVLVHRVRGLYDDRVVLLLGQPRVVPYPRGDSVEVTGVQNLLTVDTDVHHAAAGYVARVHEAELYVLHLHLLAVADVVAALLHLVQLKVLEGQVVAVQLDHVLHEYLGELARRPGREVGLLLRKIE